MAVKSRFKTREEFEAWKRSKQESDERAASNDCKPPSDPQSDAGAVALFAKACTLEGQGKDLDTAYALFRSVSERFPASEVAADAADRATRLGHRLGTESAGEGSDGNPVATSDRPETKKGAEPVGDGEGCGCFLASWLLITIVLFFACGLWKTHEFDEDAFDRAHPNWQLKRDADRLRRMD